ncbi:hypothetical protein [Methylobacterium sp. A54F]
MGERSDLGPAGLALGLLLLGGVAPAAAQGAPLPNVNDCTFIRDPIALRDCINLYQGQRLAPGPRAAAFRPRPIVDPALIAAAGPIAGTRPGRRSVRVRAMREARRQPPSSAVQIQQLAPAQ